MIIMSPHTHLPTTLLLILISVALAITATSQLPSNVSVITVKVPSPPSQTADVSPPNHNAALSRPNSNRRVRGRSQSLISIGTGRKSGGGRNRAISTTTERPTPTTTKDWSYLFQDSKSAIIPYWKWPLVDKDLRAGLILPYSIFHNRDYRRIVSRTMNLLRQKPDFVELIQRYFSGKVEDHLLIRMLRFNPSQTDILSMLCDDLLKSNISAIILLANTEIYGESTEAMQYLLRLTGNLGLPVIAWNADNPGFTKRTTSNVDNTEMVLQLAPGIQHQVSAMISTLVHFNWHHFSIVTSQIAGYENFVQEVHEQVQESRFNFTVLSSVLVKQKEDLLLLISTRARILLLSCTKDEAKWIMREAVKLGLTGSKYVWIVTQSVLGDKLTDIDNQDLAVGMLGVHFSTTIESLKSQIPTAVELYMRGVLAFRNDMSNNNISLTPDLSCNGSADKSGWREGPNFYQTLRNVTIDYQDGDKPPFIFNTRDGTVTNVELQIMNLRPMEGTDEEALEWKKVGTWRSWRKGDMPVLTKDIMWSGKSPMPPDGIPEKLPTDNNGISSTAVNYFLSIILKVSALITT